MLQPPTFFARYLVDYIKDVTRRIAVAGFVGLGVDLLSREGGTDQFTDPVSQMQAYSRTTVDNRRNDLISALDYLKHLEFVKFNRIGTAGFCAGGGNVWDFTLILPELDRSLSLRMADAMTAMLTQQKTFAFRLYQGVGHAFYSDTGPGIQRCG